MKALFIVFITLFSFTSLSQKSYQEYNILLGEKFKTIAESKDENQRNTLNNEVLRLFEEALKLPESFDLPFDSIKQVGIIRSDDEKVKIYTWNIPFNDGTHTYYGFIQYRPKKKKLFTYQLKDKSLQIKNPLNQNLDPQNWYGALYYDIVSTKANGTNYYTLLALDLNNWLTTKKIIEVLYFDKNNNAKFGSPIFNNGNLKTSRVVFEYSSKASMLLRYDELKKMIIFDHLAPQRQSLRGKFEFYGPDFSYDGLKFEKGFWVLESDLDLKNSLY